jgi:hypothetical protein
MDRMSKAHYDIFKACIDACTQCHSLCEQIIKNGTLADPTKVEQQCAEACRACIDACYNCIEAATQFAKECTDPECKKVIYDSIKKCGDCIKACEDYIRKYETSEPSSKNESPPNVTIKHACEVCAKACYDTRQACTRCLILCGYAHLV